MGVADNLVGIVLTGQGTGDTWTVTEKVAMSKGHTPGAFSVAYKCINSKGREAFLKASDLSKVLGADPMNIVGNILKATTAHDFEKQVLDHCRGNAMDRVVIAIDHGSQQSDYNGTIDVLFYLIFELAEGDLRKRVERRELLDLVWVVSTLHNFAVGVSQLHSGLIFHNDLKPANALIFGDQGSKIADLGRATTPLFKVAHDEDQCAGDCRFAPPEQLYPNNAQREQFDRFELFRAGDLYNLGSLAHYLLTGRSVTLGVVERLRPELRPRNAFFGGGWTDTFDNVMPHWSAAFVDLMREASDVVPDDWSPFLKGEFDTLMKLIFSLCEPDVAARGFPSQIGRPNQFDLQRYISALDLQRRKLMIRAPRAV